MATPMMYRWSAVVENVFDFCFFDGPGYTASTLASYKNEISGFVKKENVGALRQALASWKSPVQKVSLVTAARYWKDYDLYR